MKQEAQSILQFADSKINFDAGEMQRLQNAVQNGDAISEVKEKAYGMLKENGYKQFRDHLP